MDQGFQVIAKNIRYLREKKGYTQEQLAEAADLSVSHLSKVESGQRRIGMKAYLSILQVLGEENEEIVSIAASVERECGFDQYQDIMKDCNEAEKKFLLHTLENLKVNMNVLMFDNRSTGG